MVHKFCHFLFIFRDVFTILIKIAKIRKIRFHHDLYCKIQCWIYRLTDTVCHGNLTVITFKPVKNLLDLAITRKFFSLKTVVHFDQQFLQDHFFFQPLFKCIRDQCIQFCIQKA